MKRLTTAYERILSDGSAENAKRGKRIRSGGGWMRDILFQAKLKDTNYWVEGFYCRMRETTYCCEEDYKRHPVPLHHLIAVDEMTDWGLPNRLRLYEINPETLCQYTGLCDKNGKKIWENDIVQYGEYTAVVRHGKYTAGFYVDFPEETNYRKDLGYWYKKVSVIGNVLEDTKGNRLESHTVSESGWIPIVSDDGEWNMRKVSKRAE